MTLGARKEAREALRHLRAAVKRQEMLAALLRFVGHERHVEAEADFATTGQMIKRLKIMLEEGQDDDGQDEGVDGGEAVRRSV